MLIFRKADAKNHTDLPRPLNNNDHGHTGQQPTKYTKVREFQHAIFSFFFSFFFLLLLLPKPDLCVGTQIALKKDIGTFKAGDTFEVAQVDFFTGLTKLFRTENDFLMGTSPAYEGVYFSKVRLPPLPSTTGALHIIWPCCPPPPPPLFGIDQPLACQGTIQYANLYYVREILEFLQRGHSLLEPNCGCIHKCGDDVSPLLPPSPPPL